MLPGHRRQGGVLGIHLYFLLAALLVLTSHVQTHSLKLRGLGTGIHRCDRSGERVRVLARMSPERVERVIGALVVTSLLLVLRLFTLCASDSDAAAVLAAALAASPATPMKVGVAEPPKTRTVEPSDS